MPRSYDVTPTQITHHPTQRIDPVPGRLPDIKPQDLIEGFAKAMKMLTGVDITSTTAFFEWLKESTGLDFIILGKVIDSIIELLGINPDHPVNVEAQWAKIKQDHLDPISDFLTPDSPLNGSNLFGLLDIPFVMLRNSNQELLANPTFFGELAVGNRSQWAHVTNVYRADADPPGAETTVCNGELTSIRSNRGKVAEGQKIVGEIHVLGNQVLPTVPGDDLMRLELVSYFNKVEVGTPVSVGLTSFTLDPAGAGWVGAPVTALAGRMEVDWTVPAGVDEVLLRTEVAANAASGRVWVDSGSLQRGFNWNRVERNLQDILGILDGIASPDHWEDAYLGLKDLLSLVGIDTSGWVTSTAFDFWRDFNLYTSSMVRVFAHLGSVIAWEDAWDGLRGLAGLFGVDISEWPEDLDPGGLVVAFATLVGAGNALFKDFGNKARWIVAWDSLTGFVDKLLGEGTITWPELEPGGWFVDALEFVQNLIGASGRDDVWPKGAGGVIGQVPSGLRYTAQLDLGGVLPSGNLYYCVTAVVDGVETPPSAEVMYFGAGLGTVGMQIKLDWDAFAGATQYRIFRRVRSMAGDVDSRLIGTAVGTTFTDQTARTGGSVAAPPLGVDLAAQAAAEAAAEAAAAANNALVTGADSTVPNAPTFGLFQGVVALPTSVANSVPYPGFLELPIFYHYTVTAVTAGGKESVASAEKFVMIMSPAEVKVTWTASTTPSTTHRVYRRSSRTGVTVRVASGLTGTTFTDDASSSAVTAMPGTTTAIAGSAVASAASAASAAQSTASSAQSTADDAFDESVEAQRHAAQANLAAIQAAAKFDAIPEKNIVVTNADPQIVPEDWGVGLKPITGTGAIVSDSKTFEGTANGTGNGASSSNRLNLQLPAEFEAKAVLIFLTWSIGQPSYGVPKVWTEGPSFQLIGAQTGSFRAGTSFGGGVHVFMASNVSSPSGPTPIEVGVELSDTRTVVCTINAWMVAVDGSFSGEVDVITSAGEVASIDAPDDSAVVVYNAVFQNRRSASDNAFSDLTISAVAPGMSTNHTISNLTRTAIHASRTSSIGLTKNVDDAESLAISTTPVADNVKDQPPAIQGLGVGVVLKTLPVPQTDTVGSFAEISTVDSGAFTQTVGSFNPFTQFIEELRYSPDITVDAPNASFTVEYVGTYQVCVDLLANETHDMTLAITVNGDMVAARRCSGYSMAISTLVYARQGDVIALVIRNHASGNITLDTISRMAISLVNRSYL